jgi:hypothetical protein
MDRMDDNQFDGSAARMLTKLIAQKDLRRVLRGSGMEGNDETKR